VTSMQVTSTPTLSHLPNVELCQTGTWNLSTGPATFTTDDFMAAVAALECPAVRRPCLKLGHVASERGQAAIGYIDNMRGDENWRTLLGDFAGMPGWLATPDENGATVIASAFPDRSIEGAWDWRCQMGHTHPFVITAVSLLGAELPGVGTLASLQDVGRLYGVEGTPELVAASAEQDAAAQTFAVTTTATRKDTHMPNPTARTVAASVSSDDVRRAFYESPVGSDWDAWIEEIQLDPLQIIYIDDDEGSRYRVPVLIDSTGDGPAAVTFGEPVQVVIRYEDSTVAASAGVNRIRFASRSESRPGQPPRATAPHAPAAEPPETPPTDPEEADAMSDTVNQGLRERLGISAETELDDAGLLAAVDQALAERADPTPTTQTPAVPEGSVVVPRVQLEELQTAAQAGVAARTRQLTEDRDREIAAAIGDGRIAPARRQHWEQAYATDRDGASTALASLPKGLIPVTATGRGVDPDASTDPAAGDNYWFAGAARPAVTEG
jgi:hypothetical protein